MTIGGILLSQNCFIGEVCKRSTQRQHINDYYIYNAQPITAQLHPDPPSSPYSPFHMLASVMISELDKNEKQLLREVSFSTLSKRSQPMVLHQLVGGSTSPRFRLLCFQLKENIFN